jgi:sugar phosphate isomerase/epimerase
MRIAAMVGAPDPEEHTLAAHSGGLTVAFRKLAGLGYDGVEFMTKDPRQLDGASIRRLLDENHLEPGGLCTGHVYGEDKIRLVDPDPGICRQSMARLKEFVDSAVTYCGQDPRSPSGARGESMTQPILLPPWTGQKKPFGN